MQSQHRMLSKVIAAVGFCLAALGFAVLAGMLLAGRMGHVRDVGRALIDR